MDISGFSTVWGGDTTCDSSIISLTANVSGGFSPYSYDWNDDETDDWDDSAINDHLVWGKDTVICRVRDNTGAIFADTVVMTGVYCGFCQNYTLEGTWKGAYKTSDNGYMFIGYYTPDQGSVYIVKVDSIGNIVYANRKYNSSYDPEIFYMAKNSMCGAATIDNDYFALITIGSSGNIGTLRRYFGSSSWEVYSRGISKTTDGYILTGSYNGLDDYNEEIVIVRTANSGSLLWAKRIAVTTGTSTDNTGERVIQMNDAGFVVAAGGNINPFGCYGMTLFKINSTGTTVEWCKTLCGASSIRITDMVKTYDGGFAVLNRSNTIYRFNSTGDILWAKDLEGGYQIGGIIESVDSGLICWDTYNVFKLTRTGEFVWGFSPDNVLNVFENLDGSISIATGGSSSFGIRKFSPNFKNCCSSPRVLSVVDATIPTISTAIITLTDISTSISDPSLTSTTTTVTVGGGCP